MARTVKPPCDAGKVGISRGPRLVCAPEGQTYRKRADAQIHHHVLVAIPRATQVDESDDGSYAHAGVDEKQGRFESGHDLVWVELLVARFGGKDDGGAAEKGEEAAEEVLAVERLWVGAVGERPRPSVDKLGSPLARSKVLERRWRLGRRCRAIKTRQRVSQCSTERGSTNTHRRDKRSRSKRVRNKVAKLAQRHQPHAQPPQRLPQILLIRPRSTSSLP